MAKIHLTEKQIRYIMLKTDIEIPMKAIEYFAEVMRKENIDPKKMTTYVHFMMSRDGVK